jgi:hypothetical protein
MTKIINLFGAPGSGKSTMAAGIFCDMKRRGHLTELVTEVAKDFVWSGRDQCIKCQPLIFGKQLYRIERLLGKVDIIVTDSPLLLSSIYNQTYGHLFDATVFNIWDKMDNMNYLLRRTKKYVGVGRNQSENESDLLHVAIKSYLVENEVSFNEVEGNEHGLNEVFHDLTA